MRILHLSQFLIPGMRYQENILPAEQARLGHEVMIVASDLMPGVAGALALRDEPDAAAGVRVLRLRGLRLARDAQIRLAGLREVLRDARPDIVHLHGLWFYANAQGLRAWRGPVLADEHTDNGNAPTGISGVLARWAGRRVLRTVLARGGRVAGANPYAVHYLREALGAPADRVDLLPLGVDTRVFRPDGDARGRERARLGWGAADVVLCTSGRLVPGKGLELLLEAFARVVAQDPRARLLVIGDGPESCKAALRGQADRLGVARWVTWEGWQSQEGLNALYNAADIGVLPGKMGGLRDLLGCGRPLVVEDSPAVSYLVENDAGAVFAPGDARALADAVLPLVADGDERYRRGAAALRRAGELSWESVARDSIVLYNQCLARYSD